MKNIILFLLLFCSIGLSAQVRPDQQTEKKPEGTDAIYTQENGQLRKVLFDSAFHYFIPRIKTDTLNYSIISANNPDSLRGFFVVDNTATWYYVDSAAASVSIGSGGGGTTQLLSFSDPNLSISGGNTVDLSALKDGTGTDDQTAAEVAVTPTGNLSSADVQSALEEHQTDIDGLSSGAADGVATAGTYDAINEEIDITVASPGTNFSIGVSALLDNTDAQAISLSNDTLSITGNASIVDLSPYLDNTDTQLTQEQVEDFAGALFTGNTESLITSTYNDVTGKVDLTVEAALSNYTNDAGFLTSEVDGSTTNELQTISLATNTLSLSNSGGSVDLSGYLDNTDAQTLGLVTNTLSISGGNSVDLSGYLDNTDAQDLSLIGNTLSLTGDATSVDLSGYLDNTDAQAISLAGNTLSITGNASTVDLSGYLDNTDSQTLGVTGDDITLTNGGSVSVINTVESNTAASTTITIDLESARNRVVQIDMTSASTASTVTLSASNPVTGGVYTFHLQNTNTGGHDVDFPTNFLKADGTAWDESTTVNYAADEWLTCYYDGTNFYCK